MVAWRVESRRVAGDLHRVATGEGGHGRHAEQDRSQRCACDRPNHADWLVPRGACKNIDLPFLAFAPGRAPDGCDRSKTLVRAIMRETGLKLGTPARKDFVVRARELIEDEHGLARMIEPLLEILGTMLREFARLTKQVLDIVRDEPICRRLMSAPGVGPLTALAFRATIDQPERFGKSRDVGAHLGLTPRRYQSGETDVPGRVSRCGDELARTALYEAAHSLLVRSKKWSVLRAWGMKIAKRRGMARARVAIARKLATILHRMWVDGAEFRFGSEKAATAGASKMIAATA
jgi:hypothetical protein